MTPETEAPTAQHPASFDSRGSRRFKWFATGGLVSLAVMLSACSASPKVANPPAKHHSTTTVHHGASSTTTTTGASTTTTTTSPSVASATACLTSNLSISLGQANGAAGHTYFEIGFVNEGAATCSLYGFPGVSFLNSANQQIGAPAVRAPGTTESVVNLAPGDGSTAVLGVTDPGIPPCSVSDNATWIRIYPPGQTTSVLVDAMGIDVCGSPNTPYYLSASITPVTSSTTGMDDSPCATSQLAVTLTDQSGAAGRTYYELDFQNTSTTTCGLFGYPGVSFLGDGQQLGSPAVRETNEKVIVVNINPGSNAYAVLSVTDPTIPPCSSKVLADHVRVYPPGDTQSLLIPVNAFGVCASPDTANYSSSVVGPMTSQPVG